MADELPPWPPAWQGESYHGWPALKPAPFNAWAVGSYVFLAGLGGATSLLSFVADLARLKRKRAAVRRARYIAALGPTLGSALLIWDLHTPQRFYNMLRVAKATSPMSIGTWLLAGFGVSSLASAALSLFSRPRASAVANAPAAVLGAGMSTYTAALLAATSNPLWAGTPRILGARFGAASVASAAAALSLMEREGPARRAFDTVAAVALMSELALDAAQAASMRRAGTEAALGGGWGLVEKVGATGAGTALPLGLLALSALQGGKGNLPRVASALTLGGALLLRVSFIAAGRHAATDPAIAFKATQSSD